MLKQAGATQRYEVERGTREQGMRGMREAMAIPPLPSFPVPFIPSLSLSRAAA